MDIEVLLLQDERTGKRVMGMTPQPAIATKVASPPQCLWEVPDSWSLSQAATVPCAYATACAPAPLHHHDVRALA